MMAIEISGDKWEILEKLVHELSDVPDDAYITVRIGVNR